MQLRCEDFIQTLLIGRTIIPLYQISLSALIDAPFLLKFTLRSGTVKARSSSYVYRVTLVDGNLSKGIDKIVGEEVHVFPCKLFSDRSDPIAIG